MKIMLDCSPKKIREYSDRYSHDFWQLRTPLTRYGLSGKPYGLDNGCFSRFPEQDWMRLLHEARTSKPVFVCLPDIVGDALRTLELFDAFKTMTADLPRALVLQDGIANHRIPWTEICAVFVGGSDSFKISAECINAVKAAKMLGKWVHVGRVNTPDRLANWLNVGDSLDGSGISKYDHMLERVLAMMKESPKQNELMLSIENE